MVRSISTIFSIAFCLSLSAGDYIQAFEDIVIDTKSSHYALTGTGTISGSIYTCFGDPLHDVKVKLKSNQEGFPKTKFTDKNGEYAFPNVGQGYNYKIVPTKSGDLLKGISTYDLLLLKNIIFYSPNHLSPCAYIAADINNDKQINIRDLWDLFSAYIGYKDKFPNNKSWRFVDASYTFFDNTNPWPYPKNILINNLMHNDLDHNFIGIKIGDISSNIDGHFQNQTESRSDQLTQIEVQNPYLKLGEEYTIDFNINDKSDIQGIQFALQMSNLEVINIESDALEITNENILMSDNGLKVVAFESKDIKLSQENEIVFSLTVKAMKDGQLSKLMSLDNKSLEAEFYTGSDNLLINPFYLNFKNEITNINTLIVQQNYPNPFKYKTSITYETDISSDGIFQLIDLSGTIIYSKTISATKGSNMIIIDDSVISTDGMYIYNITFAEQSKSNMLIMKK